MTNAAQLPLAPPPSPLEVVRTGPTSHRPYAVRRVDNWQVWHWVQDRAEGERYIAKVMAGKATAWCHPTMIAYRRGKEAAA